MDQCLLHASSTGRASGRGGATSPYGEIGIVGLLKFVARIPYCASVGDGLVDDKIVHLFVGDYDSAPPHTGEVAEVAWRSFEDLSAEVEFKPVAYTCWFRYYVMLFGEKLFTEALSAA